MFRSRSTRRAILGAAFFSGALAGTPSAAATDVNELDLIRVGRDARGLATIRLDYTRPASVAAHYDAGEELVEALLRRRARTWAALQAKAEGVAWCCASRTDFALGDTAGEQLMASILADLLAA
jgi:hypothetical protein